MLFYFLPTRLTGVYLDIASLLVVEGTISFMSADPYDSDATISWHGWDHLEDGQMTTAPPVPVVPAVPAVPKIPAVQQQPREEPLDMYMGMDADTREEFKEMLISFSRKMMFVSGETAEPSVETTTLIEDIVRQQVVEIVCSSLSCVVNYANYCSSQEALP